MELFFELQDQDDVIHNSFENEFDSEATLKQLETKIKSMWAIDQEFQKLYFEDGTQLVGLSEKSLESYGVKHGCKLIVKHSELLWWPQYKKSMDIAIKPGPERMVNVKEAVRLHTRLMERGFFNVYSSFNTFRMENHHKIVSWTDENIQLMKEATESHFRAQHFKCGADDESDFICRFEVRPKDLGGSRKNTLVYVQLHEEKEETKYNVKSHHFGSSSNSGKGQSPDIKEIFCYKLLELINVGPHAQFIFPDKSTGNKTSMYIATKWSDNFVPISRIGEEDVSVEILVQILLLETFLFIDDLHSANCGQWKDTKDAAIVDFMPKGYTSYTNIRKALLNNDSMVLEEAIHIDALKKCNEKSRLKMAKEYLEKWDLLSKIDMANEQIKHEKDIMRQREIGFKGFNSPTEELDQYMNVVKQNIMKLIDMLNVID